MIGKHGDPIRPSSNRGFQKFPGNPGSYDCYHSTIHNNIQVHKNIEGIDGWFGAGLREVWENANLTRYSSKQSEERGMINFMLSLLRWHPLTKKKNPIVELSEKRKRQDAHLIEIWKATMDGEDGWFRKLSKENPECIIKIAHDCTKGVK